jgi:uncharacterized protein
MIRRLSLTVPASVGTGLAGRTNVRLLAVSDERVASLEEAHNRHAIGQLDAILGCGDLEPDYLAFLADALRAPLLLVRGNHDRGGAWVAGRRQIPAPLEGRMEEVGGLSVIGLSWPGPRQGRPPRRDSDAWRQSLAAYLRARLSGRSPQIIISHVPPRDHGDVPDDPYHAGFAAYRWLCRRIRPVLWLHGHTPVAARPEWRTQLGPTTVLNVTGAVLINLRAAHGRIEQPPAVATEQHSPDEEAA